MGAADTPVLKRPKTNTSGAGDVYAELAERIKGDEADKMHLSEDGKLYVADSYKADLYVLGFQELLSLKRVQFTVVPSTVEKIHELNGQVAKPGKNGEQETAMQRKVVEMITRAVAAGASDIHLRNREARTEVWARVDGFLEKVDEFGDAYGNRLCGTLYSSMLDVAEPYYKARESQDGRLKGSFVKECGLTGARIATRPTEDGNLMVIRLFYSRPQQSIEDQGYLPGQVVSIKRMAQRTYGINIFTGPTGSGKSTSLEVSLNELLREFGFAIHLLTIEDPTEYKIDGAVQTPLLCDKSDPVAVAKEWASSISNSLRLDPDTIMVGEMRDGDSARAAFRAAMTGHGVWTTLHTNNATQALDRLKDMGVDMGLITDASLVTGLINQSLAPISCPECKRPYKKVAASLPDDVRARIEKYCDPRRVFLRGNTKDCPHCGGRGYKGRQLVGEVMIPSHKFMQAYASGGSAAARGYWVREMDGVTKCKALVHWINRGLIDPVLGELKVCGLDDDDLTMT